MPRYCLRKWLRKYPDAFHVMLVDAEVLARGTALEGNSLLRARDNRAWVDGDLIRLLVTWAYGGVWVDMDSLLTRDLSPLLEHEFVTQWDCYGMYLISHQHHMLDSLLTHTPNRQSLPRSEWRCHALLSAFPLFV